MQNISLTDIQAVIFDLDGTLLDTAHDLGFALNEMLRQRQREIIAYDRIRPIASHGSRGLLQLGFGDDFNAQTENQLRSEFLSVYESCLLSKTRYFEGVQELLNQLQYMGIKTGVVTNKPHKYTVPIVQAFDELKAMKSIISGDTLSVAKPNPEPLLLSAQQLEVRPEHCLYVGDAARDIEAGRRANMKTVLANWGYFTEQDNPENWGYDFVAEAPDSIVQWLD